MKKTAWEIVTKSSLIQFKIKYLHISTVTGKVVKFTGEVISDDQFAQPEVYLFINGSSTETTNEQWNSAVKTGQWLIEFSALEGCKESSGKIRELTGELQIKDIRKTITLVVSYSDIRENRKKMTAVFHLFGTINRRDFGLYFLEEDDFDDEVLVNAEIVLVKKG